MKGCFNYRWNEARGDEFDDWGFSTWFIEFGKDFYPSRQLEIYDNGNVLQYDEKNLVDEFGMLADQSITLEDIDFESVEISEKEFENIWTSQKALNE